MIITKTMLGISIIAMLIIATYAIGRITIPILDPNWRLFRSTMRYMIVMLAGIIGIAAAGLIAITCMMGYAVGEAVMHCVV
jgi:hypothetical protein